MEEWWLGCSMLLLLLLVFSLCKFLMQCRNRVLASENHLIRGFKWLCRWLQKILTRRWIYYTLRLSSFFFFFLACRWKNGQGSTGKVPLPCLTRLPTGYLTPTCPQGRSPSALVEFSLLEHPPCSDQSIPRYSLASIPSGIPIRCTRKPIKSLGNCNMDSGIASNYYP